MRTLWIFSITAVLSFAACGGHPINTAPTGASPVAVQAFNKTKVIHGLDLLRDIAIEANAQTPPLLSAAITQRVVLFHASAITVMNASADGWQATVSAGLSELGENLPANEKAILKPYLDFAASFVKGL